MNRTTPAISVHQLSKTYSSGLIFRKRFEALKQVSFEVGRGEIFGLLGPNGAGKTTFLKILLGIIHKTSGQASMMGHPAGSRAGRRKVGFLPEHLRIPPHMTAYTALEVYGHLSNVPTRVIREKRDGLLHLVGLADRARDRCGQYSKGMLQRLGLAQAMLHDPELLVLDEPTDGLDPGARAEMRQIISKLADRGVTIFLNSHLLHEVELICNRVAILNRGVLRYSGTVAEIGEFVKQSIQHEPGNQAEVNLIIAGDPDAINEVFKSRSFELLHRDGSRYTVRVQVDSQDDLDQVVDALRQKQISILELVKQSVTLEDAFLEIVKDSPER